MEDLLRRLSTPVSGFIALVVALVNFTKLCRGDSQTVTIVLISLSAAALFAICLYVTIKRTTIRITTPQRGTVETKKPTYSWWARCAAIMGMVVMVMSGTGLAAFRNYRKRKPPDKLIVLVADFQNLEENYGVTETILENLRDSVKGYADIDVEPLRQTISAQDGSDVARQLGSQRKAAVVLWGWCRKATVIVHYELLMKSRYLTLRNDKEQIDLSDPTNREGAKLDNIANEVSYFVLLTTGVLRYAAKDYQGAVDCLTKAIDIKQPSEHIVDPSDAYFYRGYGYLMEHQYALALADFEQVIKARPQFATAYHNEALAYHNLGRLDEAIAEESKAIAQDPNYAWAYYGRAGCFRQKGQLDKALEDINRVIGFEGSDPDAYWLRGSVYSRVGNFAMAREDYGRALGLYMESAKKDSQDVQLPLNIASLLRMETDYRSAIVQLTNAISLFPAKSDLYNRRGFSYELDGQTNQAFADFATAIKLDPNNATYYSDRAFLYESKGQIDLSLNDCNKAINLDSSYAPAFRNRGIAYFDKGDAQSAIRDLSKAIELDPFDTVSYYERGRIYYGTNSYDNAIGDFVKETALDPSDADGYDYLGLCYVETQRQGLAAEQFNKAVELCNARISFAADADAYNSRGDVLDHLQKYDLAIADYSEAIRRDPDDADYYFGRGSAHDDKDEYDLAISDLNKSLSLKPNDATSLTLRGDVYSEKGDCETAIVDYTQVIQMGVDNSSVRNSRGLCYQKQGKLDIAIMDFDRAIQMTPNDPSLYGSRGSAYLLKVDKEKAIADFRKVLEINSDSDLSQEARKRLRDLGLR